MSFIYTRSQLKAKMNAGIHGRIGMLLDDDETVNSAVRQFNNDVDSLAAKRRTVLAPNLYNGIFDYTCPADLDGYKLIDLPAQAKRQDGEFFLVPSTEFDIKRQPGMVAIDDYEGIRVLKVNSKVDDHSITVSELDSLTSGSSNGSSWTLFGDAETLATDQDDFIKGAGSIKWNISSAAGTTAGIQHASINSLDMTDYFGGTSSFFVWAKINSVANLTNYILRFGTDSSNYYSKTVTAQADGTAFVAGWNLLKFDISSYSTTGTPTNTNIKYFVIYMTKTSGKVSETDYKFDWLVLKRGVIHYVKYYSKYGWQSSAGAYKANSTDDLDLIVADNDEYEIVVEKATELAAREVKEYEIAADAERRYKEKARSYQLRNPSESKIMTSNYYDY
jgi:hypothetical protein